MLISMLVSSMWVKLNKYSCERRFFESSLFIFSEDKQGGKFMAKSNYFFCYNKKVAEFLKSKGVYFITVAKDLSTGKVFSLYEINEQLQKALDEYKTRSS